MSYVIIYSNKENKAGVSVMSIILDNDIKTTNDYELSDELIDNENIINSKSTQEQTEVETIELTELEKIQLKATELLGDKKFFIVEKDSLPTNSLPDFWLLDDDGNVTVDKIAQFKASVPKSITPRQAELQLAKFGLYEKVQQIISSAENISLKIEYNRATYFERDSDFINNLGAALELDELTIDNLFIEASKL